MSGHCQCRWEELSGDIAVSCPKLEDVVGSAETRGNGRGGGRGKVEIGRTFNSFGRGHIVHINPLTVRPL